MLVLAIHIVVLKNILLPATLYADIDASSQVALFTKNGLKWPYYPLKIISIENEPRFSQSENILQTTVHQYRVKPVCVARVLKN